MPQRFVEVADPISDGAEAVNGLLNVVYSLLAWVSGMLSTATNLPLVGGAVTWSSAVLQNTTAQVRDSVARSAGDYVHEGLLNLVSQAPLPYGASKTLLSFSLAALVARLLYVRSSERHLVRKHGIAT